MSTLTFKEYVSALNENNNDCNFIKDPKLRKQCKKLQKKSPRVRVYGGGFGSLSGKGSGSGPGPGTGGGAGPGTGTGGGAFGGPGGGGGAFGGGGGSGGGG